MTFTNKCYHNTDVIVVAHLKSNSNIAGGGGERGLREH